MKVVTYLWQIYLKYFVITVFYRPTFAQVISLLRIAKCFVCVCVFVCIIDNKILTAISDIYLNDFQLHRPSISLTLPSVVQKPNDVQE